MSEPALSGQSSKCPSSKRKPYTPEHSNTWWLKNPAYRFYMMREGSSVLVVYFSLLLLKGLFAVSQGEAAYNAWLGMLSQPLVIVLNIIALLAVMLHTSTWFKLAPKTMRIEIGNFVPSATFTTAVLWVKWFVITLLILGFAVLF